MYLKATYKGNEIFGTFTGGEYYTKNLILIEIEETITDDLSENAVIGKIVYFLIRERNVAKFRYDMAAIKISSNEITARSNSGLLIEPVDIDYSQTIIGEKTFTTLPKSSVVPSDNTHFTNKAYVDSAISTAISQITDGDEVSY